MINLDVVDFNKEINRIEREVENLALETIHDRLDYAKDQLVIVTPVDTGKARSGWGVIKSKTIFGSQVGEIFNNVEYISYLNNGHSKQAPEFFIEKVLLKVGLIWK